MWLVTYFYTIATLLLLVPVGAKPFRDAHDTSGDDLIVPQHQRFTLRILPLGASITWGQGSSDGNGYREHLRGLLEQRGTIADMVGTVHSGKMPDNENEGHPGARVNDVALFAENDVVFKPNLILINAGTNDVVREASEYPISKIGERMYKLIEYLFEEIPGVTIILSTLILNTNVGADERIRNIVNPQYETLVKSLQGRQARIVLADLYPVIKAEELVDRTHPNNEGYEKLAQAWLKAIAEAGRKGLLVKPQDPGDPNINRPPRLGALGVISSSASSKTSGSTHHMTLTTLPVALALTSKAFSTAVPANPSPTPEVFCFLPMDLAPL